MNRITTDVLVAQIDRLVAGELPESDRRSLLAWLDEEPTRWRACAVAFLEAQAWEDASEGGQKTNNSGETARGKPHAKVEGTQHSVLSTPVPDDLAAYSLAHPFTHPPTHHSLRPLLAAAALVLVAFLAGLVSARYLPADAPVRPQFARSIDVPAAPVAKPLVATVSLPTNLDPRLKAQLQLPVTQANSAAHRESSIPDYVRQQWERRGFELTEEIRYLPATLPDGREVMVPITKVHVKFKGTPVS